MSTLGILRKILGKNKSSNENDSELSSKQKNYFQITFNNHENPGNSFTFDANNPQPIYFVGSNQINNSPFEEEPETQVIMEPKRRRGKKHKANSSDSKESFLKANQSSIILSQPQRFTWQNRDAYIYTVESKYNDDGERPDLEFVIYIPIDTAVKWLNSTAENTPTPHYISEHSPDDKNAERAVIEEPEEDEDDDVRYGTEEEINANRRYTLVTWNNKKKSDSVDSDEEDTEEEDKDKDKGPKPSKLKEKKVKVPKKKVKKAGKVITTYEIEEDEISLGRLRPGQKDKQPVKIVAADDQFK